MSDLGLAPALRAALARWLAEKRALDGAAANTLAAYGRDVVGFLTFLTGHCGAPPALADLTRLPPADLRAWMAQERGRGLSARSLARRL